MSKTIVTLSGDDAELYRAFQRIIDSQNKVDAGYSKVKEASKAAAREAKKSAKEAADAENERDRVLRGMVGSVASVVGSYASLQGAIQLVSKAHDEMIQRQDRSLQLARDIAAAQQEAAKNMAGQSPAQIGEALEKEVPRIARETGFADLSKLTTALGSASSIVGPEAAPGVVEAAARVTKFTPDELAKTSSATADIMAATGLKDAEQAMALLASTGAVARPEQLSKLATGSAVAINAAVASAPTQNKVEAAGEAAAVYAKLSAVDPEGQSAATATVQLIKQISDVFTDTKAARERTEKIDSLRTSQTDSTIGIERQTIAIEERRARADAFAPADNSTEAREARNDLAAAEANLTAARQRAAKEAAELAKLETIARVTGTGGELVQQRETAKRELPAAAAESANALAELLRIQQQYETTNASYQETNKRPDATQDERNAAFRDASKSFDAYKAARDSYGAAEGRREDLQRTADATADPGTFAKRLALVQQTPELRQQVSENLTGEAKFQPLMRDLLTAGSDMSNAVAGAAKSINTNPETFRAVAGTTVQTTQAKIVDATKRAEAEANIASTFDSDSQVRAAMGDITSRALREQTRGVGGGVANQFMAVSRGITNMTGGADTVALESQGQLVTLLQRLQAEKAGPDRVEAAAAAIASVQELARLPAVIEAAQQNDDLKRFYARQEQLQTVTNDLLRELRDANKAKTTPPLPPAAQRAQATQPVVTAAP